MVGCTGRVAAIGHAFIHVRSRVSDHQSARLTNGETMIGRRLLLALAISAGFGMVCLLGGRAHADVSAATIKEWRSVHITTCADVRTVVAAVGEGKAGSGRKGGGGA